MIRRSIRVLLAALVAAFALSSIAEAAPAKTQPRHRATASARKSTGKRTRKRVTRTTKSGSSTTKRTVKRRPTTKPR